MANVDAIWIGPNGYRLASGLELVYGETVVSVPAGEAELSDNWQPVLSKPDKKNKSDDSEDTD